MPEEIWRKAGECGPSASPPRAYGAGGRREPPWCPPPPATLPTSLPEEAVNEVKRQAMSELQKAVSDAERKAHELITTERAKMERALAEAKRQASEDALTVINQQEDSSEVGWDAPCGTHICACQWHPGVVAAVLSGWEEKGILGEGGTVRGWGVWSYMRVCSAGWGCKAGDGMHNPG